MYFQYLIEDQSGEILIRQIMQKLLLRYPEVTYDCKSFKGIGGFAKKTTVREIKTGKLLNDLVMYLRGFSKSLRGMPAVIVVVLDNDDHEPEEFRQQLDYIAVQNAIDIDHVFCIAVEEMEAWLLGDEQAILKAYPNAKRNVMEAYVQDSICGTWEVLADAIYPGGRQRLHKEHRAYLEIGKLKSEWAENIGSYMVLEKNVSPSFQLFIEAVEKRCAVE